MNLLPAPAALLRVTLLCAALLLSGCSDFAAAVRKVTYPPDFQYVTTDELQSRMDQMAMQLQLLDEALGDTNAEQSVQQQRVLSSLRNIERIASSLQAGDAGASHPFLEDFMPRFVADVSRARNSAATNPPSYYLAGRVAGGCVNCHQVNRYQ